MLTGSDGCTLISITNQGHSHNQLLPKSYMLYIVYAKGTMYTI